MKLKVRYDESVQTIDLDAEATEQLWVSLSLEGEDLTQKERERMIQDAFEEQFNRPDYNSWHKFDRHRGYSKAQPGKDDGEDDVDTSEPLMSEVADDRIFRRDEIERERCESYEDICEKVRIIEVSYIAGLMAAEIGADENNITQKLKRAEKRIRENWK